MVDWSHDLCTEHERRLWARVSVFSGGFDLAAAEAVCSGEGLAHEDVMDVLAGLVHKSIVTASCPGDRTRYRLPETIRQYGQQRLDGLGQGTALRRRHRDHYRDLVARAAADWCGPREAEWMARLRQELPNLRAALDFCITQPGQAPAGVEIAAGLTRTRCWFFLGSLSEGRHWLERTLALSPRRPGPLRAGGAALITWIALCQGDQEAADAFLADCRDAARQLTGQDTVAVAGQDPVTAGQDPVAVAGQDPVTTAGQDPAVAGAVAAVEYIEGAHAMLVHGDARAIPLLARARDRFRQGGEVGDAHMATMMWAMAAAFLGDRDIAVAAGDAYLADAETSRGVWAHSWALWCLGLTELRHGEPRRAAALIRDSLRRQREIDDSWGPVWGVETLAWAVAAAGQHDHATRLLGAAHRLRQSTGVVLAGLRPFHDAHTRAGRLIRRTLDARAYATAFEHGAHTEDVIGLALEEDPVGGDRGGRGAGAVKNSFSSSQARQDIP